MNEKHFKKILNIKCNWYKLEILNNKCITWKRIHQNITTSSDGQSIISANLSNSNYHNLYDILFQVLYL